MPFWTTALCQGDGTIAGPQHIGTKGLRRLGQKIELELLAIALSDRLRCFKYCFHSELPHRHGTEKGFLGIKFKAREHARQHPGIQGQARQLPEYALPPLIEVPRPIPRPEPGLNLRSCPRRSEVTKIGIQPTRRRLLLVAGKYFHLLPRFQRRI